MVMEGNLLVWLANYAEVCTLRSVWHISCEVVKLATQVTVTLNLCEFSSRLEPLSCLEFLSRLELLSLPA